MDPVQPEYILMQIRKDRACNLILGKPWKFGILYRSLNDSEVPFTYRVHVCAGKPASEPTEDYVRGAALAAVKTLQAALRIRIY